MRRAKTIELQETFEGGCADRLIQYLENNKPKIGQTDQSILVIGLWNNFRVNIHSYSILVRYWKLKKELEKKEKEISETGKVQEERYVLCVSRLHFLLQKDATLLL